MKYRDRKAANTRRMPHPRTMPRREVEMECVLFVFIYDAFKFALSWPQGTSGCMQSLTRTPKTDRSRGHSGHIERGDIKTHPRILPTTFNTVGVACSFVCHPAGICCCRCLFSSTHPQPPGAHPEPPDRATVGERIPSPAAFAFLRVLRAPPRSPRPSSPKPASLQGNSDPQTIFHEFTQQNRMSSPQTHQKTNNSNHIYKIKLSPKRFLVMVNPI